MCSAIAGVANSALVALSQRALRQPARGHDNRAILIDWAAPRKSLGNGNGPTFGRPRWSNDHDKGERLSRARLRKPSIGLIAHHVAGEQIALA